MVLACLSLFMASGHVLSHLRCQSQRPSRSLPCTAEWNARRFEYFRTRLEGGLFNAKVLPKSWKSATNSTWNMAPCYTIPRYTASDSVLWHVFCILCVLSVCPCVFSVSPSVPSAETGKRLWRPPPSQDSCPDATIAGVISIPGVFLCHMSQKRFGKTCSQ